MRPAIGSTVFAREAFDAWIAEHFPPPSRKAEITHLVARGWRPRFDGRDLAWLDPVKGKWIIHDNAVRVQAVRDAEDRHARDRGEAA